MVDLVITAASVVPGTGAVIEHGTSGDTITAGVVVYLDEDGTGRYEIADADSATTDVRKPRGIALHAASDGQPLAIIKSGPLTLGAILTAGVAYYLSPTPGGICPVADLLSGDYPSILGIASSTSVLQVDIQSPGAVLA